MTEYLEKPVFICGHRKTGTTMLINLFDGAEDAVVFPDDSTFFYMYYPRYTSDSYSINEKKVRLAEVLLEEVHKKKINNANCSEKERSAMLESLAEFKRDIYTWQEVDFRLKPLLMKFIEGYNKYFQKADNPKRWIEKTTSTEVYALELANEFPSAKFIHIIRDPRDNWGSLSSGWEKRYVHYNDELNRLKQSMIERSRLGFEMGINNERALGKERYKLIRFEDLTANPQKCMKELADFSEIEYTSNLLYPSTFGYRWEGNNFDGEKFSKPSTSNVNRWKERISDEDAALIEFHFRDVMEHFGYKTVFSLSDSSKAASEHYKWFNFSTPFSAK